MTDNSRYSIVDTQEDIESNNNITFGEPSYSCFCRKKQYGFQIVNWIAIAVHFLSFFTMIIIYAGEEPVTYPYTETFIQWKRPKSIPIVNITTPSLFQLAGGTDLPYVQDSLNWNRCIQNISKTDCKNVKYLQKFQNDSYWVVKPDSAEPNLPHGCLHVNYDLMDVNEAGMKYREVQWNENTDSVKCSTTGSQGNIGTWNEQIVYGEGDIVKWSIDGGEFTWQFVCNLGQTCIQGLPGEDNSWYRLEGSKMKIQNLNHGNCLCTTNYINGADVFDNFHEVQEGVTDERVTFEVCRSYALLKDVPWLKQYPTKDPFLPQTFYSLPNGCLFHYDPSGSDGGTEYRYNTNPSFPHDCSRMSGSKWHCVVYDPDKPKIEDANTKRRLTETETLPNGCLEDEVRINTTNDGAFCIGATMEVIDGGGVDLGLLIIFFHVLSFVFQLAAAYSDIDPDFFLYEFTLPWLGTFKYEYVEEIKKGRNSLRFIEYGFSATIMLVSIAVLNGVTDINLVASIGVLTAATQMCGLVAEYLLSIDVEVFFLPAIIVHVTAWLQFFCAYGVIFHAYFKSAYSDEDIQPPGFVTVIIIVIFLLYTSFGIVQEVELAIIKMECFKFCDTGGCRVRRGRMEKYRINYKCKEMAYVALSLSAKLFLGWMLFSNVIFRMS